MASSAWRARLGRTARILSLMNATLLVFAASGSSGLLPGVGLPSIAGNARADTPAGPWDAVYTADALPPPLFDTSFPGATTCSGTIEAAAGFLHGDTISSRGTCLWVNNWTAKVAEGYTLELRSKDVRGGGYEGLGFAFWGSGDVSESAVEMSPSQLILQPGEHTITMSTADWHAYRMTVFGGNVKLYIDGTVRINTTTQPDVGAGRHFVGFGDGSGVSDSEYYLDYFAFTTSGAFSPSELPSPAQTPGEPLTGGGAGASLGPFVWILPIAIAIVASVSLYAYGHRRSRSVARTRGDEKTTTPQLEPTIQSTKPDAAVRKEEAGTLPVVAEEYATHPSPPARLTQTAVAHEEKAPPLPVIPEKSVRPARQSVTARQELVLSAAEAVRKQVLRKRGVTRIGYGIAAIVIGVVITLATITSRSPIILIAWGPVVYGIISFFAGVADLVRSLV